MKRLFVVKDSKGKVVSKDSFDDKMRAKAFRDLLGGIEHGYYVSRGKDHIGVHGNSLCRMRRQPK